MTSLVQSPFITAMIIPTGTGAAIGGFAGDATPYMNLLASVSDVLITHPNVANAAVFQKLPENALYVEGYGLDQFMQGNWSLRPVRSNRIGVVFDAAITADMLTLHLNTINAAKTVYGLDIIGYVVTDEPIETTCELSPSGCSTGQLKNPAVLLAACARLVDKGATAIALCTQLPELSTDSDESSDDSAANSHGNRTASSQNSQAGEDADESDADSDEEADDEQDAGSQTELMETVLESMLQVFTRPEFAALRADGVLPEPASSQEQADDELDETVEVDEETTRSASHPTADGPIAHEVQDGELPPKLPPHLSDGSASDTSELLSAMASDSDTQAETSQTDLSESEPSPDAELETPTVFPIDVEADYRHGQGVDPIGGIEGILSHLIVSELGVPCAHAPVFPWETAKPVTDEVLDPRAAAEFIAPTFLPCVLTGLSRAPQMFSMLQSNPLDITASQVSALVVPANALGGPPVLAALELGIPVLAVENNRTVLTMERDFLKMAPAERRRLIISVSSYEEAAGYLQMMRLGLVANTAPVANLDQDSDEEDATLRTDASNAPGFPYR
jgi:Protein of unknown function (DUF3326)